MILGFLHVGRRILVVSLQSKGRKMILGFLHVGFIQGNSHTSHSLSPSPPQDPEIKHSKNGIRNPEPESWTISMSAQRISVVSLQFKGMKMTLGFLQVGYIQGNLHLLHHNTLKMVPVVKLHSQGRKMTLGFLQVGFIPGYCVLPRHSTRK